MYLRLDEMNYTTSILPMSLALNVLKISGVPFKYGALLYPYPNFQCPSTAKYLHSFKWKFSKNSSGFDYNPSPINK